MESCLQDLLFGEDKICHIYLDDVIIATKTFEDHLEYLDRVFEKFKEAGMKLSPKKCHFFRKKVKYVGHIVSKDGIETDPDKIAKVEKWPRPTNPDELRTFLGFVGYYRRFVKGFSSIAKPLNDLLGGQRNKKKSRKKSPPVSRPEWNWSEAQETAFNHLVQQLINPPVLSYPVTHWCPDPGPRPRPRTLAASDDSGI